MASTLPRFMVCCKINFFSLLHFHGRALCHDFVGQLCRYGGYCYSRKQECCKSQKRIPQSYAITQRSTLTLISRRLSSCRPHSDSVEALIVFFRIKSEHGIHPRLNETPTLRGEKCDCNSPLNPNPSRHSRTT
ncbi:hypothetical protein V6N13_149186 [Hibiscus sabdariffa]